MQTLRYWNRNLRYYATLREAEADGLRLIPRQTRWAIDDEQIVHVYLTDEINNLGRRGSYADLITAKLRRELDAAADAAERS